MNKLLIISFVLLGFFCGYAQEGADMKEDFTKNEFRVNALSLLLFKSFDVTYERAVNDESSYGINTMFSLEGASRFSSDDEIY